jgi:triosephosphate isomerase (TIM)
MKYVIANWKMNMDLQQLTSWVREFKSLVKYDSSKVQIILAPSHVHLALVSDVARAYDFQVASQDVSVFEQGAHTGENGAFQIKDFCNFAIIGHSERREDPETVYRKRTECLKVGLTPIVCFVQPSDCTLFYKNDCFIVWEDPDNISKGGVFFDKDPNEILEGVKTIRLKLPKDAVLIYGGSVNKDNIQSLKEIEGLDGVLVGAASLDPKHFAKIIDTLSEV